jgi:hypothetical protein
MFMSVNLFVWLRNILLLLTIFLFSNAEAKLSLDDNIGIWLLDEGKGDVAKDSSPNKYDGELKGGKWVKGKFGQAIEFKKGDTVVIPLGKGSMKNKASVIMWLQFTDIAAQQNYFSVWDSGENRLVPYKDPGNMLRCWSNKWNVASGVSAKKDQWYHIANVYDGKTARIYIDGKEKVMQDVPKFELSDTPQTAWLATDKGGWISACVIDEFVFFSRAVTDKEVNELFTKGVEGALSVDGYEKLPTIWANLKK